MNEVVRVEDLARLQARKAEIEGMIRHKQENLLSYQTMAADELSLYDQHPADTASELYEREKEHGLLEMLEYELEKVSDALNRYQQGQYGICQECGQPIEAARLEALVNTSLCAGCANSHQLSYHRPVEEESLSQANIAVPGEAVDIAGHEFYDH
ncbi:MAG TPA: TraR/DksA C4-type zinc finger protein [Syntrophomonadaceae bacterium]|nr:TraR/DksA C4-type zinc finger protein [Syntrophomonadaceae bacterium]